MLELLNKLDTQLFVFLNKKNSPLFDKIMHWISDQESWYPLYILIIIYIIYKFKWKAILTIVFIALLVTLSDQTSVHLFKNVFERLRPCHNSNLIDIVHLVNDHCGGKYGFVSSHASNTFAVAVFLSLLFKNRIFGFFIFSWASVVAYSRIYLGVHYPGDIIAGALLGASLGWLIYYFHKLFYRKVMSRLFS